MLPFFFLFIFFALRSFFAVDLFFLVIFAFLQYRQERLFSNESFFVVGSSFLFINFKVLKMGFCS